MSTVTAHQPSSHTHHVCRLGEYAPVDGTQAREILGLPLPDGSILVIDCLPGTRADARLLARLAPEEPIQNARIMCDMYLADESRGRCRHLTGQDLGPASRADPVSSFDLEVSQQMPMLDAAGRLHRIRIVAPGNSFPELCWTRCATASDDAPLDIVTLRDVIAALEDYEPARAMTVAALTRHEDDELLSTCRLAGELERVTFSPIVLNRGLREAVQSRVASGELNLSEIAIRCGRTKTDRRGNLSGETSWLTRRIGVLPEGGQTHATPWVHSDTLALIAREGLGLSPNDVEL